MITARLHLIFKNLSKKLVIKFHWPNINSTTLKGNVLYCYYINYCAGINADYSEQVVSSYLSGGVIYKRR